MDCFNAYKRKWDVPTGHDNPALEGDNNGAAAEPTPGKKGANDVASTGTDVDHHKEAAPKSSPKAKVINIKSWVAFMSCIAIFLAMDQMIRYAVLTTLEKRFGFSSVMNGIIVSSYDMGHVVLLVVLSYAGSRVHRPRMCAFGGFISALSGFLWALPHFIFGSGVTDIHVPDASVNATDVLPDYNLCPLSEWGYNGSQVTQFSCEGVVNGTASVTGGTTETWVTFVVLFISQALLGAGYAPFLTVAITYLDDNTDPATSAVGVSIFLSTAALGPVIGFLFGGLTTSTYVDLSDTELTPDDPEWIGAWWLGSLCVAAAIFIFTLPMLAFPRNLQTTAEQDSNKERKMSMYNRQTSMSGEDLSRAEKMRPMLQRRASIISDIDGIRDVPVKTRSLWTNPVFICVSLAMCCMQYLLAGLTPFVPKFIETQFQIDAFMANIITAVITALAAGTGTFVGGYIAAEKELNPLGSAKLIIVGFCLGIACFVATMFLGCHQVKIAGIPDQEYILNATTGCNIGCGCDNTLAPVCGTDNTYYYSACHAGCTGYGGVDEEGITTFTNCSCIAEAGGHIGSVTDGWCEHSCPLLIPYAIIVFIAVFTIMMGASPLMSVLIRTVDAKQKSLALGVNNILTSIISSIPGPMFYGSMIDSTCELYLPTCEEKSVCIQYSNDNFRYYLHGVTNAFMVLALVFMVITYAKLRKMDFSHLDQPADGSTTNVSAKPETKEMVEMEPIA